MKKPVLFISVAVFCLGLAEAQDVNIPQLGVEAPSFTAMSTEGTIDFPSDFGDSWKIVLSHPKDFTPVCSSEILELAYEQKSFERLNAKLVVVSTDIIAQHRSWKEALEEIRFQDRDPVEIKFPFVADNDLTISRLYGMIHSATSVKENIRGVYIIDPDNIVKSVQFYPNEVGRNVDEIKRTLLALQQTHNQKNLVTPADWQPGGDLIVPVLSEEEKKMINSPGSEYYQYAWFLTYKKGK
jgi:peroxiredoxin (alkyl hydroperoxide reductase subunit C)